MVGWEGGLVSGWKITQRTIMDERGWSLTDLTRFLLKVGQGDEVSPAGLWRVMNLME